VNPNAAKGSKWERDIRDYLRGWLERRDVTRPRQEGFGDVGDIHVSPFVIQAKNVATASLGAWLDAAHAQAARAGERYGVVAWKRRGKGAGDGFIVMSTADFREVVWRLRSAEEALRLGLPYATHVRELEDRRRT
jgi:hypothetical protein